jgi:purine-binding chemotaxis protein CheW
MEKVVAAPSESTSFRSNLAGKYLTFALANEAYGVPVLKVREIITMLHITMVPQMPPYVKGVINLRGKVIPAMPAGEVKHIGLIVDAVEEVANVAAEDIEPAPDFGGSIQIEYILGMAKVKGAVKSLLDIDKVIAADEIKPVAELF